MRPILDKLRYFRNKLNEELRLTTEARRERKMDRAGPPEFDPGAEALVLASMAWLSLAQDNSRSRDGGVSRHYSLLHGWGTSYPETTGYIVSTFLQQSTRQPEYDFEERARHMLDWLVKIQLPDGGFQGGKIDSEPVVPVTFNTGQILLGLASGAERWSKYLEPMERAATWLVRTQDDDGCWRRFPTPFAGSGEKAYETHVSWGLLEAARVAKNEEFAAAALRNIRWALESQYNNGWVENCCLAEPKSPLTHTLGYFLRGVLEGYRYSKDTALLDSARLTADGLLSVLSSYGVLPGRLDANWQATVNWNCLTGMVQVAECWLMLYEMTGEDKYLRAGRLANSYVRRTVRVSGRPDTTGGVKGSFPVDGGYGRYEYLNWAAKFFIDSNQREIDILNGRAVPG